MKISKVLLITFLLSLFFLAGCGKNDEAVNVKPEPSAGAQNGAVDFSKMTEEERTQQMIKMIEKKEADMKSGNETK
jgi:uncharacterized lipoprotein YajG